MEILRHLLPKGPMVRPLSPREQELPWPRQPGDTGRLAWDGTSDPLPPGQSAERRGLFPSRSRPAGQAASGGQRCRRLAEAGGDLAAARLGSRSGPHPRAWPRRTMGADLRRLVRKTEVPWPAQKQTGRPAAEMGAGFNLDGIRGGSLRAVSTARSPPRCGSNCRIHSAWAGTTCVCPNGRAEVPGQEASHLRPGHCRRRWSQPPNCSDSGSMRTWASRNPPAWPRQPALLEPQREHP